MGAGLPRPQGCPDQLTYYLLPTTYYLLPTTYYLHREVTYHG